MNVIINTQNKNKILVIINVAFSQSLRLFLSTQATINNQKLITTISSNTTALFKSVILINIIR